MPRSASVVGLAKRGVIPRKQFYTKLLFFNTVILVVHRDQRPSLRRCPVVRRRDRLFECIRTGMVKGSPAEYNTETGSPQPAQKLQTGEPNERKRKPLYRIRRPQEKHQLLREAGRRQDCGRRQAGGQAGDAVPVGQQTRGAVARGHGSNPVQRMDLRYAEAVCGQAGNGAPGEDESHWRVEEEKRQAGRANDLRPDARQPVAGVLGSAERDARAATDTALSQPGVGAGGADEEQDQRTADGERRGVQQEAAARGEVFPRIAGESGSRSAGIGKGSAGVEPGLAGELSGDAAAVAGEAAEASDTDGTVEAAEEYPRRRRGDRADVGAGDRRSASLFVDWGCGELLRIDVGVGGVGGQAETWADFQTTQCASANGVDRSGQVGAAVEPAIGGVAPSRDRQRKASQSSDLGSGAQAGGVSVGGGQEWQRLRRAHTICQARRRGETRGIANPGYRVVPPFPAPSIMGEARRWSRVRYAAPGDRRALDHRLASPEKPAEKRERGAMRNLLRPGSNPPLTVSRRFSGRSSPMGTARRTHPPDVPSCLFRCRPVSFNSIFVDGLPLFPQMDVWSRCGVGQTIQESLSKAQRKTRCGSRQSARQKILLLKVRRRVFFLDKSLSWKSPFLRRTLL